jgi:hypothetical protein
VRSVVSQHHTIDNVVPELPAVGVVVHYSGSDGVVVELVVAEQGVSQGKRFQ